MRHKPLPEQVVVIAAFGGFDTWVNVAGVTVCGPLRDIAQEDYERLIRTNFWRTVNGSLVAVEHLRAWRRPRGGAGRRTDIRHADQRLHPRDAASADGRGRRGRRLRPARRSLAPPAAVLR